MQLLSEPKSLEKKHSFALPIDDEVFLYDALLIEGKCPCAASYNEIQQAVAVTVIAAAFIQAAFIQVARKRNRFSPRPAAWSNYLAEFRCEFYANIGRTNSRVRDFLVHFFPVRLNSGGIKGRRLRHFSAWSRRASGLRFLIRNFFNSARNYDVRSGAGCGEID